VSERAAVTRHTNDIGAADRFLAVDRVFAAIAARTLATALLECMPFGTLAAALVISVVAFEGTIDIITAITVITAVTISTFAIDAACQRQAGEQDDRRYTE